METPKALQVPKLNPIRDWQISPHPFIKRHTNRCCPTLLPSKPMWHAKLASRNTFMIENTFRWTIKSCRKQSITATEHGKGISCLAWQQVCVSEETTTPRREYIWSPPASISLTNVESLVLYQSLLSHYVEIEDISHIWLNDFSGLNKTHGYHWVKKKGYLHWRSASTAADVTLTLLRECPNGSSLREATQCWTSLMNNWPWGMTISAEAISPNSLRHVRKEMLFSLRNSARHWELFSLSPLTVVLWMSPNSVTVPEMILTVWGSTHSFRGLILKPGSACAPRASWCSLACALTELSIASRLYM